MELASCRSYLPVEPASCRSHPHGTRLLCMLNPVALATCRSHHAWSLRMLDPSPRATSRTPQPSQAVPKRLPEAPRLPGGYPDVIRRLSGFDRYGSSYILSPMELASCRSLAYARAYRPSCILDPGVQIRLRPMTNL